MNKRFGNMARIKSVRKIAILGFAALGFTPVAQAAENDGSWVGLIKKEDAQNVSFVAGGKKYDIEGPKEAELLQYDSQRVRLSGRLEQGKDVIQVSQVETFNDEKRVPAANRSDGTNYMKMNMADSETKMELDPSSPENTR